MFLEYVVRQEFITKENILLTHIPVQIPWQSTPDSCCSLYCTSLSAMPKTSNNTPVMIWINARSLASLAKFTEFSSMLTCVFVVTHRNSTLIVYVITSIHENSGTSLKDLKSWSRSRTIRGKLAVSSKNLVWGFFVSFDATTFRTQPRARF